MRLLVSATCLLILLLNGACTDQLDDTNTPISSTLNTEVAADADALIDTTPSAPVIDAATESSQAHSAIDIVKAHESVMRSIYTEVTPSVVHILAIGTSVGGSDWMTPSQGEGSGFVWDLDGHIVTNYHVVAGAQEVVVTFWNGNQLAATVVGEDPFSDLAVLNVNPTATPLLPVKLGDDDSVQVGDFALAIGHPFRQKHTMTSGIISAIGRTRPSGTCLLYTSPSPRD